MEMGKWEKVNTNWGCFCVAVVIFDDDKMSQRIELTPKVIKCLVSSVLVVVAVPLAAAAVIISFYLSKHPPSYGIIGARV